MIIIMH